MYDDRATVLPHEATQPDGTVWQSEFPASPGRPAWSWRHVDLVNARGRAALENEPQVPLPVRRTLTGTDETPRIMVDDTVIGGVLPSYARTGAYDEFAVVHWHFAATPTLLLTARRHSTRSLAGAWHHSRSHAPPPSSPIAIVLLALADFGRAARARMGRLDDELDSIEDRLLAPRELRSNSTLAARIGQVRREAVEIRRALAPVVRALNEAEETWPAWAIEAEHDSALSELVGVIDDIAALNERARSLQDELTSRLADETNRQLYVVSVVTALVMPATFVTGFFGMNTGGFIWGEGQPWGTLYAGLTCLAAVVAMAILLKWRRML